jgi:hypothetical protein
MPGAALAGDGRSVRIWSLNADAAADVDGGAGSTREDGDVDDKA